MWNYQDLPDKHAPCHTQIRSKVIVAFLRDRCVRSPNTISNAGEPLMTSCLKMTK